MDAGGRCSQVDERHRFALAQVIAGFRGVGQGQRVYAQHGVLDLRRVGNLDPRLNHLVFCRDQQDPKRGLSIVGDLLQERPVQIDFRKLVGDILPGLAFHRLRDLVFGHVRQMGVADDHILPRDRAYEKTLSRVHAQQGVAHRIGLRGDWVDIDLVAVDQAVAHLFDAQPAPQFRHLNCFDGMGADVYANGSTWLGKQHWPQFPVFGAFVCPLPW